MEHFLTWRKGLFDSNYQIYNQSQIQASLFFSSWKNDAQGIGLHQTYLFTSGGLSNPTTRIIDQNGHEIGLITYHFWQLKATISLNNQEHSSWAFSNAWLSKWTINNYQGKEVHYQASSGSGTIFSDNDDELLLLSGLFIKEYFARIMILFFIILILPILMRGF